MSLKINLTSKITKNKSVFALSEKLTGKMSVKILGKAKVATSDKTSIRAKKMPKKAVGVKPTIKLKNSDSLKIKNKSSGNLKLRSATKSAVKLTAKSIENSSYAVYANSHWGNNSANMDSVDWGKNATIAQSIKSATLGDPPRKIRREKKSIVQKMAKANISNHADINNGTTNNIRRNNHQGMSSGFHRAPLKKEDLKLSPTHPDMLPTPLVRENLVAGSKVVYPSHGVGLVLGLEIRDLGGQQIELVAVNFESERMTLRIAIEQAKKEGLRSLLTSSQMAVVLKILKGKSRIKRIMWAKRAQEYEAKINSGDASLVAEVVRDLYRAPTKPEQSFSEKQLFQMALERLARELAAIEEISLQQAIDKLMNILAKASG